MTSSTVLTTITPSALSSNPGVKENRLSPTQITVVILSVAAGLLILLFLIFVMSRCRSRSQKYEHPENCSKSMDSFISPQPSKNDLQSKFKRAEADPLIIEQKFPPSDSQYLKDAYTLPSPSVKNDSAGLASHIFSLDITQPPKDNVEFEIATLHSGRPSSSKSTIKVPLLSIPGKTLHRSNGLRSNKGTVPREYSKPSDSGWETDDSASLYSVASASAYSYISNASLATIKPPPVPPIPIHFASPAQSTLPKDTDVIVKRYELPPLPSFSPPSLFSGDNGEEVDDEIYNVAKLLQSRQLKLPKDAISRDSSIVSHIERSGSINVIIPPTDEKSYRPRYYRMKQKRVTEDSSSSNLSPFHIPDSLSTLSTPHPRALQVGS